MKIKIILFFAFWLSLFTISCNNDEITFDTPSMELRFSTDTVFCDTVYHQVRSETYAVKVYNDEDKDISIPKISLFGGVESPYRINVDGKSGTEFMNVPLRKKDSLYIFVEIAPTSMGTEAIAEDQIVFSSPVSQQHVTLFSVVQDAEFFIETDAPNSNTLTGNVNWTNNKAKIIYGDLNLASGATLNISQGTKVYFFKNSGMKVNGGATLNINGDLGSEVVIRGDRNDPRYDTIPKNWNSIKFEPGANLNMNYARVFGGTRGLELKESTATIKNSIIHTFDEYGIYAVNSTINAENLVMNNCQHADFGIFKGGNYTILHSTLANYWQLSSSEALSIFATNEWVNENGQTENAALNLNISNSILYTKNSNAVRFNPITGQNFAYQILNSLLKYDSGAGFNFEANSNVINSLQNMDPKFVNYYTELLNLRVANDSPAKGKGNISSAALSPLDILKVSRTASPTLGAYQ